MSKVNIPFFFRWLKKKLDSRIYLKQLFSNAKKNTQQQMLVLDAMGLQWL